MTRTIPTSPHRYRCETCKHHDKTRFDGRFYFGECKKLGTAPLPLVKQEIYTFPFGLCCHSDFQSDRAKVLDDLNRWVEKNKFTSIEKREGTTMNIDEFSTYCTGRYAMGEVVQLKIAELQEDTGDPR